MIDLTVPLTAKSRSNEVERREETARLSKVRQEIVHADSRVHTAKGHFHAAMENAAKKAGETLAPNTRFQIFNSFASKISTKKKALEKEVKVLKGLKGEADVMVKGLHALTQQSTKIAELRSKLRRAEESRVAENEMDDLVQSKLAARDREQDFSLGNITVRDDTKLLEMKPQDFDLRSITPHTGAFGNADHGNGSQKHQSQHSSEGQKGESSSSAAREAWNKILGAEKSTVSTWNDGQNKGVNFSFQHEGGTFEVRAARDGANNLRIELVPSSIRDRKRAMAAKQELVAQFESKGLNVLEVKVR